MALDEIVVEPKTITVSGAHSIVKPLSKVDTEAIVLDNVSEDIEKKVKIRLPNNTLRVEKEEERIVLVRIKIVPEMTDRFFENIPLLVKEENRTYKLSPDSITALVHGPKIKLLQTHTPRHLIAGFIMGAVLYFVAFRFLSLEIVQWYLLILFIGIGLAIYILVLTLLKEFNRKDYDFFMDLLNPKEMYKYVSTELKDKPEKKK